MNSKTNKIFINDNWIETDLDGAMVHKDKARRLSGHNLERYKVTLALNQDQKEVLDGILLGDGYLNFNRSAKVPGYYLVFAQSAVRANYVDHVYQILKPFVGTPPKINLIGGIKPGLPPRYEARFRTYRHDLFKSYYDLYYPLDLNSKTRKKRVPYNVLALLTPRALAYMYMDDGNRGGTGITPYYNISSHGFDMHDNMLLKHALQANFGIISNVLLDHGKCRLYIKPQSHLQFKRLIKPYIQADFAYKL
jgi:LAGLIDADG DNA endonuclease family